MKVYIFPNQVETFKKKVANASKHLTVKPQMTFSEPMMKKEVRIVNWKCDGEHGQDKHVRMIEVVEVEIDEITSGDWILVANVFYKEGFVGLVNAKHFKDIPQHFGLDYIKCDYCGHKHPNRIEAHIVYNKVTGEWMQVGTSCGKKMFECGDIFAFTIQLYKAVEVCLGCLESDFAMWCSKAPDHSWQEAYHIDILVPAVVAYRNEVCKEWEKSYWLSRWEKVPGTTTKFKEWFDEKRTIGEIAETPDYTEKVKVFVKGLQDDDYMETDPYNGAQYPKEGFNSSIKRAFENEYVQLFDIFKVFFAVKNYEESLTVGDWEQAKAGVVVGEYVTLTGATLISKDEYEDEWGRGWYAKFDCGGVTYCKSFSNWYSFEDAFKQEDNTYRFSAKVAYINDRKREIKLGGRVRKVA